MGEVKVKRGEQSGEGSHACWLGAHAKGGEDWREIIDIEASTRRRLEELTGVITVVRQG